MLSITFVREILFLAFAADDTPIGLSAQIPFLEVEKEDHTGVGAFVHFKHRTGIVPMDLDSNIVWDGPQINCPGVEDHAYTLIHIRNGLIDHLEIFSVVGDLPTGEISIYRLQQMWVGAPGAWIEVDADGKRTGSEIL
ncbi:MAG: hypothetical protein ABIY71_11680 [Flavobacteriales bacterium]